MLRHRPRTVASYYRLARRCCGLVLLPLAVAKAAEPVPHQSPPDSAFRISSTAGAYRCTVTASIGVAQTGTPGLVLGAGCGAMVHGLRLDLLLYVGAALREPSIEVNPTWNDDFRTYTAARTRSQSFLFELTGSQSRGALELWGGIGVHWTQAQLALDYDAVRCTDLLCLGPRYPVHDTDWVDGSWVARPLLAAGVRLPFTEHLLVGLEARELFTGTSRVDGFSVSRHVGGFALTAEMALRLGGRVGPG
jgi:hypothetical protein